MATRTVNEGFRCFLTRLTPTQTETEAAKGHRASIEACLKAQLGLRRFFRTGSFGNGTSISGHSDVDYFASIPKENLGENSSTALARVRKTLDSRFPRTGVRVSCPAVIVPFGTDAKETTEVVPAWCAKLLKTDSNDYLVYSIPDCDGGWMASSPAVHNLYVRSSDQALNGKLKPLIRFIKAWKYYLQVPISSFYLELRITHLFENANSIACYDLAVTAIFSFLYDTGLAKMQDPMGISGYVSPCSTYAKLEESESKLLTALVRAEKATEAKEDGNIKDAFFWWNRLYGDRFPSYYKSG